MQPLAYDPRPLAAILTGGLLVTAGCTGPGAARSGDRPGGQPGNPLAAANGTPATVTDDGGEYALPGPGPGTLRTGGYVRVRIGTGPPPPGIDCGPDIPAALVSVEPIC